MRQQRNGTSEGGCDGAALTLSPQSQALGQDLQAAPGEAAGTWQGGFGGSEPSEEGSGSGGGEGEVIERVPGD